jgi:tetratricopeptide (TPR) repeat protein
MGNILTKYGTLWICLALTITTVAVFCQLCHYDFVNFDDLGYVKENLNVKSGFTREGIKWAFTSKYASNWHPLTWLSHMLDCQLYGTDAGWHHLTNVFLHIVNTLLLFAVLRAMTGALWQSAFVAAAFSLHPLHVESVAWISERKDVLSTLFWLLTMAAYLRYVKHPGIVSYLLTLLSFALGLMAKPMLVTLPFVLLLLDYWPLGRFRPEKAIKNVKRQRRGKSVDAPSKWNVERRLIWEKVPFFTLSAVSSIITFFVQKSWGAVITINQLPLNIRIANASISYVKYIVKMVYPRHLTVFYPHSDIKLPMLQALAAALLLLGISAWVIYLAQKRKYLLVGWLWYLGTLVPVIGLVQVGGMGLADRYTYIPFTGLFIIIAWGFNDLLAGWKYRKITLNISAAVVLSALAICSWFQVGYWRNSISLFEHAIEVTEDNYLAHSSLASALQSEGKIEQAFEHFYKALQVGKNFTPAYVSLGAALIDAEKTDEAIGYLTKAIQLDPKSALAYGELGRAMAQTGKINEAIALFEKAHRLEPDWVSPINALAWHLATHNDDKIRNPTKAVQLAKRACELTNNEDPGTLDTLAAAYAAAGRFSQAIETAEKALELCQSSEQNTLKEEIKNRLVLYKAGKPYIEAR